jgi:hypothetical protein
VVAAQSKVHLLIGAIAALRKTTFISSPVACFTMPLTELYYPILSRFFCIVEKRTGEPVMPLESDVQPGGEEDKKLPPGIVLGPDGKPCV